jgi:hypothetical protein
MRAVYAAVACIATACHAGDLRADAIDAIPSRAESPSMGSAAVPQLLPGAAGVREKSESRETPVRLAQVGPSTAPIEKFSGNPSLAPFKWVGLLSIPSPTKQYPNETLDCTAQFIAPRVLLTAGHCVKELPADPAGSPLDVTKGTFLLQFQNGRGTAFKIVCAAANPLWELPSNYASMTAAEKAAAETVAFQHDFAMILVDRASPDGVMPYALDWKGKADYAYRIGYPANILDAEIVQATPGIVFFSDAIPLGSDSSPNLVVQWGPVTDATQGMSGGAWVVNPNSTEGGNNNILIAVTSFSPVTGYNAPAFPGGAFAAYLKAVEFDPLLKLVANGCK